MHNLIKTLFILCMLFSVKWSLQLYNSEFDKIYKDYQSLNQHHKGQKRNKNENKNINSRFLQTGSRFAMRITLDTNDLSTIKEGKNGASNTSASNLNLIKRSIEIVQYFLQIRLKVTPVSKILSPSSCIDHTPPANDISNGIANSDLHIYVLYTTDKSLTYRATAGSCAWINGNPSPDPKMQEGRPIVGRIIFNTYTSLDQQSVITNRIFADLTATALHQVIHILGFDSTRYNSYLDPNTGQPYTGSITETATGFHASRPATTILLKTPLVLEWARDFFDCSSISGMQLQNEDTGISSHWQRSVMYDELMTSTQLGAQKGISGLTFSLLKDMGWYDVDSSYNDTTNYGYHKGCDFFNSVCYSSTTFSEFCDAVTYKDVSRCASNFLSKALCVNDAGWKSDGCGIYAGYFHCVDPSSSDDGYKAKTLGQYGTNSFCIYATLGSQSVDSTVVQSRCYPYECKADKSIEFTVGAYNIICLDGQSGVNKTNPNLVGSLTCPIYESYCQQSRKICKNWCSSHGICTRGICNCEQGYSGQDCSKTICTGNDQYYNPSTDNCVTVCPTKTYQNKYSKTCLPCDTICNQCKDQSHICTACISTINDPKYFYMGACQSTCPTTTYIDGDQCQDCDVSVNCKSCSTTDTNCTSCLNDLYLSTPTHGSCGSSCDINPYTFKNLDDHTCVQDCPAHLIKQGSTKQCQLCPAGSYKISTSNSCHSTCPTSTFKDDTKHFCSQCDASCKQCNGPYAQNCTECKPTSSEKYLLLKMCVTSCPRGTYNNDVAGQCTVCPNNMHCSSCFDQSGTVICSSCQQDYYYQSNRSCLQQCDGHHYKNRWNRSCQTCNSACQNCSSPSQSSCLTCSSSKFFLTNITGGYCLDNCPTEKYVTSGTNCVPCYQTCQECNGATSSHCFSCIDGLYLHNGYCRYVCPQTTYPDDASKSCKSCNSNCTFCFGPTIDNCTACLTNLVLNNFTCATSCPSPLNADNSFSVCVKWNPNLPLYFTLITIIMVLSIL